MHKTLIISAFDKARLERQKQGEKKPSLTHIAEDLALFIKKSEGLSLDEKSYRNYLGDARKYINTKEDISIKQLKVVSGLCRFLDFENYEDFLKSLVAKSFSKSLVSFFRKNKITLIILFMLIASSFVYYSANKQRWMVWEKDHYIEVKFDTEKYNLSQLKLYSEERIKHLKKIDPDCNTEFFGANSEVKIWYGKNNKKELEYFTALGLHPETGKTLDPITVYMIRKYICEEY